MNLQDYYNNFLDYNPDTGIFIWKKRTPSNRSNNIFNILHAGKVAGYLKTSKKSKTQYLAIGIHGKYHALHRVAFAIMAGYIPKEVDHIDHNGLNNKWNNLRASNSFDNSKNLPMQKSNKSGCIGVNWHKAAKKWHARAVDMNGKRIDLGRYDNIDDAIRVRKEHEIKFGYYEHRGSAQ